MKQDLFKMIAAALLGALLAGGGAYVSFARNIPTRAEVVEMIEIRSPYQMDKQLIFNNIKANGEQIAEMKVQVRELIQSQNKSSEALIKVATKVDVWLDQAGRD